VPDDTNAGIDRHGNLKPNIGIVGSIGDLRTSRVNRLTHGELGLNGNEVAHAASVQQPVQHGPVRDKIDPILHPLRFEGGIDDGTRIEIISGERHRSLDLSLSDEIVDSEGEFLPLTEAHVAHSRRQPFYGKMFARKPNPATNDGIITEKFQRELVGAFQI
jgi:hypothetical protein